MRRRLRLACRGSPLVVLALLVSSPAYAEDAKPLQCPRGSELHTAEGPSEWCERSSSKPEGGAVLHGPFRCSHARIGRLEGEWQAGLPAGSWRGYRASGQLEFEGAYDPKYATAAPSLSLGERFGGFVAEPLRQPASGLGPCRLGLVFHAYGAALRADSGPAPAYVIPESGASGQWRWFDTDGKVRIEGRFVSGRRTGVWVFRSPNGGVQREEPYHEGKREGTLREHDATGRVVTEERWEKGILIDGVRTSESATGRKIDTRHGEEGVVVTLLPDGTKLAEDHYREMGRDGWSRVFWPGGSLRQETPYRNGRKQGVARSWYEDGTLRVEAQYVNDKREGPQRRWYEDGSLLEEGIFEGDRPSGASKKFYRGAIVVEETIDTPGEETSVMIARWPTGALRKREAIVKSAREGPAVEGHPNGQKSAEGEYRGGRKHGLWRRWHDNGQLAEEATYINGMPEGIVRRWYDTGVVIEEQSYSAGKRAGTWRYYDVYGELQREEEYVDGRPSGRPREFVKREARSGRATLADVLQSGIRPLVLGGLISGIDCPLGQSPAEGRTVGRHRMRGCISVDGLRQGPWVGWYEDDTKWLEATFVDGESEGRYREWYENGVLAKEVTAHQRKLDGPWKTWHASGAVNESGSYRAGEKVGVWKRWYASGLPAYEETWEPPGHRSSWKRWSEEGALVEQGTVGPDDRGRRIRYSEGAAREEQELLEGQPDGRWARWGANGELVSEGSYRKGLKHGDFTTWSAGGYATAITTYVDGKEIAPTK